MKPKRRTTKSSGTSSVNAAGPTEDGGDRRERLSRSEAALDVPRADDFVTTSSTHTRPLERRTEEPSDGRTAAEVEGDG